jgi:hypothetical protein
VTVVDDPLAPQVFFSATDELEAGNAIKASAKVMHKMVLVVVLHLPLVSPHNSQGCCDGSK